MIYRGTYVCAFLLVFHIRLTMLPEGFPFHQFNFTYQAELFVLQVQVSWLKLNINQNNLCLLILQCQTRYLKSTMSYV